MMNTKVLQRTDDLKALEVNIKNKWNWSWLEERDGNGDFLSEYIRKVNQPGIALCVWCNKQLKYASASRQEGKLVTVEHGVLEY